jgi:hypothetical protein
MKGLKTNDNLLRSMNMITQKIIQERKEYMNVTSPFSPIVVSSSASSASPFASHTWVFFPIIGGLFAAFYFYKHKIKDQ